MNPSPTFVRVVETIDTFSNWTGKAIAWLIVPAK